MRSQKTQEPEKRGEMPVSFKLSHELLSKIDAISKDDLRSRSATVRIALAHYVHMRKRSNSSKWI